MTKSKDKLTLKDEQNSVIRNFRTTAREWIWTVDNLSTTELANWKEVENWRSKYVSKWIWDKGI